MEMIAISWWWLSGRRLQRAVVVVLAASLLSLAGHRAAYALLLPSLEGLEEALPFLKEEKQEPILDPRPGNGSWAVQGHRPLGIHLADYNLTQQQIDAARETGCDLVRLAIPMEKFFTDADPDWAVLDRVVSRLKRAELEVMPVLTANSAVPEFYREFCQNVAERYGSTFNHYQLLDKINLKPGLYTRDYADLLSVARISIALADPDAKIVSGGIRGADLTYLDMLERQGALDSLDVLAFDLSPTLEGLETVDPRIRTEHSLPYMRDVVKWAGLRGKRVWVTSLGVPTCYNNYGVDQVDQAAAYCRSALILGYSGVERIIFAGVQDTDPSYQYPALCCGMLDVKGRPKASFFALQNLNEIVHGAYHVDKDEVPFKYWCDTFQQPEAEDLLVLPKFDLPDYSAITEFQVYDVVVYGFWFYAPVLEEYRLVYWLGKDRPYEALLALTVAHSGLTPLDGYILLDTGPSPVERDESMPNWLFIKYQPLQPVPGVIRFEVNEHGRPG